MVSVMDIYLEFQKSIKKRTDDPTLRTLQKEFITDTMNLVSFLLRNEYCVG